MKQTLLNIVNKVDNSQIRHIKNARGDDVIVVPSFTMVFDSVLNDGLYPASELIKAYNQLDGAPAPVGHPIDTNGEYISAHSEEGVLYYQCGVFNKNAQLVEDETHGMRVYVEKHIHVNTAKQTERGQALLAAVNEGKPIHTSTGLLLVPNDKQGVNNKGQKYSWVATNMALDHDAILLDEEGAATPRDGVGIFANHTLHKQVTRNGAVFAVNSMVRAANEEDKDTTETQSEIYHREKSDALRAALAAKLGDQEYVYVEDFTDTHLIFENDSQFYKLSYSTSESGTITLGDTPEVVRKKTAWETVTNKLLSLFKKNQATTNPGENDMFKQFMINKLKDAKVDLDGLTDEQILAKFNELKTNEEDDAPTGETVLTDEVKDEVAKIVAETIKAGKDAADEAEKKELAEQLGLDEDEVKSMSVNSLRKLAGRNKPAFGIPAPRLNSADNTHINDTLPE